MNEAWKVCITPVQPKESIYSYCDG
jgi:hypothetical protein